jgi:hypothetical protein
VAYHEPAPSLFVGRSAAMMCHPMLAWPRLRPAGRVLLVGGYTAIAYLTALVLLVLLGG